MNRILLLLLSLAGASLPAWADTGREIVKFHQATSESFHCCWDVRQDYVNNQGPLDYDASTWIASAHADGTAVYGAIGGNVSASASRFSSYSGSSATGRVRDYFVDTFTISSASLPFGAPVQVQVGVSLQFNANSQMVSVADVNTVANAVWHFGGPDAPWIVGAVFDGDAEGLGTFGGTRTAQATFASTVGANIVLVGDLLLVAAAFSGDNPSSASSSLEAQANYTVQVLTANAGFSSASGATYVTAVPEPSAVLMLASGLVVLLGLQRRRAAAL